MNCCCSLAGTKACMRCQVSTYTYKEIEPNYTAQEMNYENTATEWTDFIDKLSMRSQTSRL